MCEDHSEEQEEEPGRLGDAAPEHVEEVPPKELMRMGMAFFRHVGVMPPPFAEHITPEHIDKVLDLTGKDAERGFHNAQRNRIFALICGALILAFLTFLTVFLLPTEPETYKELARGAAAFLCGACVGYGLKSHLDREA